MVLIVGHEGDAHTTAVRDEIIRRGRRVVVLDTGTFGVDVTPDLLIESRSSKVRGGGVDWDAVESVWWRRPRPLVLKSSRGSLPDGRGEVLSCIWTELRDRFWVNPYWADRVARLKPYQLALATEVGLEVPHTRITNLPTSAVGFCATHRSRVIYKSLSREARGCVGRNFGLHAVSIDHDDVCTLVEGVALAPCLFQEQLEKIAELRVTIMGSRLFVHEIRPGEHSQRRVDWRADLERRVHRQGVLPARISECLLKFVNRMGIVMACLDIAVTAEGRYVFLEANPHGQWLWSQQLTGLPLLEAFADMLIHRNTT